MFDLNRADRGNRRAFTRVELLVVIAITALLIARYYCPPCRWPGRRPGAGNAPAT